MNSKFRRMLGLVLVSTIFLGTLVSLGGCKKSSSSKQIDPDTWYDYNLTEFELSFNKDDYRSTFCNVLGTSDNGVVFQYQAAVWNMLNYPEPHTTHEVNPEWIDYYSFDGELISHKPVYELEGLYDDDSIHAELYSVIDNNLCLVINTFEKGKSYFTLNKYDLDTLDLVSSEPLDLPEDFDNVYAINMCYDGENILIKYSYRVNNNYYECFGIYNSTGLVHILKLEELITDVEDISGSIYGYDEDNWIIEYLNPDQTLDFALVNKNSYACKKIDHDISSKLVTEISTINYSPNYGLYFAETDGIKSIDFEKGTESTIFKYSNTFANLSSYTDSNKIEFKEDKIIIAGVKRDFTFSGYDNLETPYVCILTPSDNDPRDSRTELKLACVDMPSNELFEAISEFNISNDQYYITMDSRYQLDMVMPDFLTSDEYDKARMEALNTICDTLVVDLQSGEGPDLIFGGFEYNRITNSGYLVDLNEYAANLSSDEYFTSILDASKTNGKLYQLPISFVLQGIVTNEIPDNPYGDGLNYEEYEQIYSGICNGNDPIKKGRDEYFMLLFNTMYDLFIDGDKANIANQNFYDLANYVKDNIPKEGRFLDSETMWYRGEVDHAILQSYLSFSGFLDEFASHTEEALILGIPSSDEREAIARIMTSIAVSSSSNSLEGCYAFIDYLLSGSFEVHYAIPLSINQYNALVDEVIEAHNKDILNELREYTEEELISWGNDTTILTNTGFENFVNTILNVKHVYTSDSTVSMILSEEMPAFFEGQKSLDEVVNIIENRINLCLSER